MGNNQGHGKSKLAHRGSKGSNLSASRLARNSSRLCLQEIPCVPFERSVSVDDTAPCSDKVWVKQSMSISTGPAQPDIVQFESVLEGESSFEVFNVAAFLDEIDPKNNYCHTLPDLERDEKPPCPEIGEDHYDWIDEDLMYYQDGNIVPANKRPSGPDIGVDYDIDIDEYSMYYQGGDKVPVNKRPPLQDIGDDCDIEIDEYSMHYQDEHKVSVEKRLQLHRQKAFGASRSVLPVQNSTDSDKQITHETSECLGFEEMVEIFKPLIIKNLIVHEILPYLPFLEDHDDLYAMEKTSRKNAVVSLLNELKSCKELGKWHKFIDALSACGYEYIVQNIRGYRFINHHYQIQYIMTLTPKLSKMLQPIVLLPRLHAEDVISESDREEIDKEHQNHGSIAAAIFLLHRIPKKHSKWYTKFISVLRAEGYDDIADDLDIPELTKDTRTKQHKSIHNRPPLPLPPTALRIQTNTNRRCKDVKVIRTKPHESVHDGPRMSLPACALKGQSHTSGRCRNINKTEEETLYDLYNTDDYGYEPVRPITHVQPKTTTTAPPLPPKGIAPIPGFHSKWLFCQNVSTDQSEKNAYQDCQENNVVGIQLRTSDSDGCYDANSLHKTTVLGVDTTIPEKVSSSQNISDTFHNLRHELTTLETENSELDEEIILLERKNCSQSDMNVKLRKKRELLREIKMKEKEAEALRCPLDEPGEQQGEVYPYLWSASSLAGLQCHRNSTRSKVTVSLLEQTMTNLVGDATVKIWDPNTFDGIFKSKLSDHDSGVYTDRS